VDAPFGEAGCLRISFFDIFNVIPTTRHCDTNGQKKASPQAGVVALSGRDRTPPLDQ
jgi:hypothetical protein